MSGAWPVVRLAEVLQLDLNRVDLNPSTTYQMAGVLSFGRGLFQREPVSGSSTSYRFFYRLKPAHVVMSQLFGWEGALALSSDQYEGFHVSPQFPTFLCDAGRLDRKFLGYAMRRPSFWQDLGSRTKGMGDRRRTLNPEALLSTEIPLPPLDEQRHIVARIEALSAGIEEGRSLRMRVTSQTDRLFDASLEKVVTNLLNKYQRATLLDLVDSDRGISYGVVLTGAPYHDGVPTLRAGDLQRFRVRLDNVKRIDPSVEARYRRTRLSGSEVLLRIRGGLGELAVCPREMVGGNVSREIAVIPFNDQVYPKYGMYVLSAPCNQAKMTQHLRGTSYQGINLKDVRAISIPVPPPPEQQRIAAYLDGLLAKMETLKRLQAETAAELDALLPSILDKAFKGEM